MKNTAATTTFGTLRSRGNAVEYVAKCAICRGTMIVQKDELTTKTAHDLCRVAR